MTINALPPQPLDTYMQQPQPQPQQPPSEEEYEPHDAKLAAAVAALHAAVEKRTLQLAALRREKPAQLAAAFGDALAAEERRGQKLLDDWHARVQDAPCVDVWDPAQAGFAVAGGREDEVERTRRRAQRGLAELQDPASTGLGRVVGQLTKAHAAATYVLEKRAAGRAAEQRSAAQPAQGYEGRAR